MEEINQEQPKKAKVSDVFCNKDFSKLWIGQLISNIGTFITQFTFPLLAFFITGKEFWLGVIAIASLLPAIFLSPFAGMVVDTYNRKRIMMASHMLSACLIMVIPISFMFDSYFDETGLMIIMTVVSFFSSTIQRFFYPAESASIPKIVKNEEIGVAVSIAQTTQQIITVLGPILGILLATTYGYLSVFYIDAATFFIAVGFIVFIKTDLTPEKSQEKNEKPQIILGLKTMFKTPSIRFIGLLFFFVMFGVSMTNNFLVAMAKDELFLTDGEFGFAISMLGLAGVLSGLLLTSKMSKVSRPLLIVNLGIFINGATWLVFSTIDQSWQFIGLLIICGLVNILVNVPGTTVLMRDTQDHVRGQVFSSLGMLMSLSSLFGMIIGTIYITIVGTRFLFFFSGFLQFGVAIFGFIYLFATALDLKAINSVKPVPTN